MAQTLVSTRSNGTMGSIPKSIAGNREVPLNNSVVQVLRTHRTNQNELRLRLGKLWNDNNLVFPNTTGKNMEPSVANRALKRTVLKSGID